jgi:hypothetical protein
MKGKRTAWNKGVPNTWYNPKGLALGHGWNKGTKGVMKPNRTSFTKGERASPLTEFKPEEMSKKQLGESNTMWKGGKPKCLECGECVGDRRVKRHKSCYKGSLHHKWRGGVTPTYQSIRGLPESRMWRTHVFQRDGYACTGCGDKKGGNLNADHIIPFFTILQIYKIKTIEDARACDFLWDIRNGRTLCENCHIKTPTYGIKVHNYKLK